MIVSNTVSTALKGYGGGMYVNSDVASPATTIENNLISGNQAMATADSYGGGLYIDMQSWTASHPDDWSIIQNAIWALKGEITAPAGLATTMYNDAQVWGNYRVLPGEWAAVLFWDNPQVQVLFVMVDP